MSKKEIDKKYAYSKCFLFIPNPTSRDESEPESFVSILNTRAVYIELSIIHSVGANAVAHFQIQTLVR